MCQSTSLFKFITHYADFLNNNAFCHIIIMAVALCYRLHYLTCLKLLAMKVIILCFRPSYSMIIIGRELLDKDNTSNVNRKYFVVLFKPD